MTLIAANSSKNWRQLAESRVFSNNYIKADILMSVVKAEDMRSLMRKVLLAGIGLLIVLEIVVSNVDWINYKLFGAQIILAALLLIYGISRIFNQNYLQFKSGLGLPILGYLAWIFVSFLFSQFKSASGYALFNVLVLVVFYFLVVACLNKREELNYLINLWIFTAVCLSIYAILFQEREIMGSFGNPNLFASFLVSTIPIALVKFYQANDKEERYLYLFSLLIFLISLHMTGSRIGSGAAIFAVLLFLWLGLVLGSFGTQRSLKGLSLALVLGLVLALIFHKQLLAYLALGNRVFIWQGTLRMIKERLFLGWGIGNFVLFFPKFAPAQIRQIYPDQFVNNAHNEFLTLTAELGIIGLILFAWLLSKIFLLAKRNFISNDNYVKVTTLGALSSIIGVLLINLFDVSLRFVFTALFWWLAVAILAILDKMETKVQTKPAVSPVFYAVKGVTVLVSVFLGITLITRATYALWASREYNKSVSRLTLNLSQMDENMKETQEKIEQGRADAQTYFKLGTIYAKKGDWERARDYLEKAIAMEPKAIFAYNNLGNVYINIDDIDKAVDCYRQALEIAPDYLNGHHNLGFAYFWKRDIKEALREFDFVLSKNRRDYETWQVRQLIFE